MEITILGIDLGKTTCSVAGLDGDGAVVLLKRIRRHRLLAFLRARRRWTDDQIGGVQVCGEYGF